MKTERRKKHGRMVRIIGIIAILLVIGASYLGISTARYMKEIIREQFNQQQLILARATAEWIQAKIRSAITDLVLLNSLPAIQYADPDAYEILLLSTLPILQRDNILEIRRVGRDGSTLFVANDHGVGMQHFDVVQKPAGFYLSWASDMKNRGKTMGTGVRFKNPGEDRTSLVVDLVIPTYEDSANALHPRPSHRFSGYLRASVDISRLLQSIMPDIKSGKTGYAWVIDSSGIFLYHPEKSLVGESAFDARSRRNPAVSFSKINEIQREGMLKGGEGTGLYTSAWHHQVVEPMEKLIAYAPVAIEGPHLDYLWSVAVVAPVHEIEGVMDMVYTRQILLQGLVFLVILCGSVAVVLYELRWSTILEHEVAIKTEDIRRYADELERSEGKYRSLVESAEDLIFSLNREGIIQTVNQHMCRLFGFPREALLGRSLHHLLPREQAEEQVRLIEEVLETGKHSRTETIFNVMNEELWFNVQYIPLRGEDEESGLILGIARDITERKSLERQLINAEKLASLGTLAAGVAHEINNPLGIMLGFCDLLMEKIEPGTLEYSDLKTIERHGLHCKGIVERLLSFARISEETQTHCDVNENIEAVLSVVRHTLKMNNIQLVTQLEEGLPPVCGDPRGLQQVFLNLISNAIHALDGKGTLTLRSCRSEKPDWVEVLVEDDGCGISREVRERIFDPFFTTKKVGEGTGLGLSVSYGIVSQYGGTIRCESRSREEDPERSGTRFFIQLRIFLTEEQLSESNPSTEFLP